MIKILFITQYFPPEIGAPQNRLFELALRLQIKGMQISVLTAMPNYPEMRIKDSYKGKLFRFEEMYGLKVYRSYIFVKKTRSIFPRLLNYFSFVFSSFLTGLFKTKSYDFIFCESPPIFLGITAIILSKIKKAKLIFNVSDLWPESAEKLGLVTNKFLLNITGELEEIIYKSSFLITGQTQGIVENISKRFPQKKIFWLKNGVDINSLNSVRIDPEWREKNNFNINDFLLIYAGILGYAQGLETIIYSAEKLKGHTGIKFIFFGDGPEKSKLVSLKNDLGLNNIYFNQPVSKKEIRQIIKSIDAAIIPLKKIELFKGAIPSKILEVLALGKPILLGVNGEARDLFIKSAHSGLYFEPENFEALTENILKLYNSRELLNELGKNGNIYIQNNFNSEKIAEDFLNLLQSNS